MEEAQKQPRSKRCFIFVPVNTGGGSSAAVYVGPGEAALNEETGDYELPVNATFDEPQFDPERECPVRIGDRWETCSNVARKFWHKETGQKLSVIDHPAFLPAPETHTDEEPAFLRDEREKAALREQLAPLYARALDALVAGMATPEEKAILDRLKGTV